MRSRLIILLFLLATAPIIIAAEQGISGSGQGCGCPFSGEDGDQQIQQIVGGGVDGGGGGGGGTVTKGIFDFMPDVDTIVLIKIEDVLQSPIVKPLLDKINSHDSDASSGDVSQPAGSASAGRGIVTMKNLAAKGLMITKEAILPGDINYIILGLKFDWPSRLIVPEGGAEEGVRIRDIMIMAYADDKYIAGLKGAADKILADIATGREEEIEGIKFKEYAGPDFCDDDQEDCPNTMFYLGQPGDKMMVFATKEITQKFVENLARKDDPAPPNKSVKGSEMWAVFQALPQYCSLCAAMTAPLAELLKKDLENNEEFADGFYKIWIGQVLPKLSVASFGLGFKTVLSIDIRGHLFDSKTADFSFSTSLSEALARSIDIAGLIERLEISFDDDDCHSEQVTHCNPMPDTTPLTKSECEESYVLLEKSDGTFEPHNCKWGKIPESDGKEICFTMGKIGEHMCKLSDGGKAVSDTQSFTRETGYSGATVDTHPSSLPRSE